MLKLFINVRPRRAATLTSIFTDDYVKKLTELTDVERSTAFDDNDVVSLLNLNAANKLLECLRAHNIVGRVGIIYNYSCSYPGWLLIVETYNVKDLINPLVANFFNWDRIESQNILPFKELMAK